MLIGISGFAGSGKDTVANLIVSKLPRRCRRYAFAKPIKDACKVMFGWTDHQLEDRILKETVDPFWGFSPRFAMQRLGTQYGRGMLRDDVWIMAAAKYVHEAPRPDMVTIITDVRFENEASWVRSYPNSVVLRVVNPTEERLAGLHESEAGIQSDPRDYVILNDKREGLRHLSGLVDVFLSEIGEHNGSN